jgi:hypothetical protein
MISEPNGPADGRNMRTLIIYSTLPPPGFWSGSSKDIPRIYVSVGFCSAVLLEDESVSNLALAPYALVWCELKGLDQQLEDGNTAPLNHDEDPEANGRSPNLGCLEATRRLARKSCGLN